jgi:hypothetical protein
MSPHALALLPSRPPAAEEAGVAVIPPVTAEAEAAGLLLLPLLLLLLLLTIALRQPPAEDECELQNESYVSIVVLCVPVPTVDVTGGAVGMSNVFDGRNDEREAGECGCVDADGGGFCGDAGVAARAGECIRGGADAGAGERVGADAGGDTSAKVGADVGAGTGACVGVGEGEEGCASTSDGKVAWGFGGKVSREVDMSDGCTAAGNGGDVN